MASLHPLLRPFKPSAKFPFDSIKAAHLLQRAGFGGKPEEIKKVMDLGPQATVDWLMDFPDAGAEEISKTDVPDLSPIADYPKNFREIAEKMRGMTPEERMVYRNRLMQANREAIFETGA